MIERREGENNRSRKRERDGWRRKEVRPQQSSGRFQLVMETGVAHPAAVVTDFTCPPDIHLQSSSSSVLQLQAQYLCPSIFPSSLSFSIHLLHMHLHSLIICFYCLYSSFLFYSLILFSAFVLFLHSMLHFPFSLWPFSHSDSWALTAFYISFLSATAREQPCIGVLVQTNRRPCGSPRVATRHNKPPAPGRCRHMVHRAPLRRTGAKWDLPCWFPWRPDSNIAVVRCGVTADGSWCIEPPGQTVWRVLDGITTVKTGRGCLFLVWKITLRANIAGKRNEIKKEKMKNVCSDRLQGEVCAVLSSLW